MRKAHLIKKNSEDLKLVENPNYQPSPGTKKASTNKILGQPG
jgi:hypothetical protein